MKKSLTMKFVGFFLMAAILNLFGSIAYSKNAPPNDDIKEAAIEVNSEMAAVMQQFGVTGTITDETGNPMPGVNIRVEGTTIGSISDANGRYSISVPGSESVLVFSFVGYATQTIQVAGKNAIDVVLKEEIGVLDEVLVVGYGTVTKKDATGSIVNVPVGGLSERPAVNITDAIQGRVAGVTVTNNGGSPAELPTIRIRGLSTLNSEGPLWIVDGIINANGVDPAEIESITILKDASAAIYGTRASAGVILVTTKKGNKGIKVEVDANYGWRTPWKMLDVLDAAEYCDVYTTIYQNAGQPVPEIFSNSYFRTTRTDWLDAVFQTGVTQDYNLTISGGSDRSTYSVFANWKDIKGSLHNTFSKTGRVRIKSDHKLGKLLTLGENISLSTGTSQGTNTTSGYTGSVLGSVYYPPSAKIWSNKELGIYSGVVDPNDVDVSLAGQFGDLLNPYAQLDRLNGYNPNINALVNAYAIIEIIYGLKFKSNFSYDSRQNYSKDFTYRILEPGKVYDYNRLSTSSSVGYSLVAEQLLTYEKTFKGVHKISALAGYTAEKYESQNFSISARGFAREEEWAQEYANASDFTTDRPSSGYGSNALVSMLGRIAYSYADKYYLTGVVRRDGTSKVTKENRWGVFPSVSLAWRVSEESFLRDVEILNDLKIRASWGKMGNINPLGNYEFAVPLSLNNRILRGVPPTLITGYYMNGISNRELKWETTASQDIGFDALLLNNRLSITADYYNKKVTDMLVRPELIQFAGVGNSPWVNAGETKNTGIELMLGWRDDIGNFDYDVSLNIAHNKNELVKYKAGKDFEMHGDNVRSALYPFRSEIGYPFYSFYLIEYAGIFQSDEEAAGYVDNLGNRIQPNAKAGDMKFVDRNSDGKIDFNDKRICGDYYPDLTYGMNISLSYKNFDCSMFFQGVQNVDIFTGYKFSTYMPTQGYNMLAKAQDAWSPTNKGSDIPILQLVDANRNYSTESDWYLEDGSYLRLKNFTLGYNLPGRLLSFAGVSRFRVYFSSQNLLTFTKYEGFDPEIGENGLDMMKYPQSRTFMFGANISF